MDQIIGILEQGMIYAVMALGVYITYRILDFPDLTVDGSFPLGAAVTAVLIEGGANPVLSLLAATGAGALAGLCTGLIHVKCKVRDLLAGIIMMTALYSVNLHIAGKANLPIFGSATLFKTAQGGFTLPGALSPYTVVILSTAIAVLAKLLLDWYLTTRSGMLLRAAGDNDLVVTSLARHSGHVKVLGLVIANALVALSGGVLCQQQRFFEITMGTGTMVMGLAIVIIGTNLFRHVRFVKPTTAVLLGSVLYKACVSIALSLGLNPVDKNLMTALLFLAILVLSGLKKKKVKRDA